MSSANPANIQELYHIVSHLAAANSTLEPRKEKIRISAKQLLNEIPSAEELKQQRIELDAQQKQKISSVKQMLNEFRHAEEPRMAEAMIIDLVTDLLDDIKQRIIYAREDEIISMCKPLLGELNHYLEELPEGRKRVDKATG